MLSSSSIHRLIWSNFKDISKFVLFLCGFDSYSLLCSLVSDLIFKLLSLELVLKWDCVYSRTARNHFIKACYGLCLTISSHFSYLLLYKLKYSLEGFHWGLVFFIEVLILFKNDKYWWAHAVLCLMHFKIVFVRCSFRDSSLSFNSKFSKLFSSLLKRFPLISIFYRHLPILNPRYFIEYLIHKLCTSYFKN